MCTIDCREQVQKQGGQAAGGRGGHSSGEGMMGAELVGGGDGGESKDSL